MLMIKSKPSNVSSNTKFKIITAIKTIQMINVHFPGNGKQFDRLYFLIQILLQLAG
jgi:hypothetical protein